VPRVVDARSRPRTDSGAPAIQPRTQDVLASLGVLDRIRALALPQRRIEVQSRTADGFEMLAGVDLTDVSGAHPAILNLAQPDTESVLADRAAELGVTVERGVTLTHLSQDPDGVDVVLHSAGGDERVRFDWVVGADGGHSAVRGLVGTGLHGRFPGSHFLIGDAVVRGPDGSDVRRDVTRLIVADAGLTAVKNLPNGLTRLMFQIPDPGPGAGRPDAERFRRLAAERAGLRTADPAWSRYRSVYHGQVPRYRIGRVLLVGDAAHVEEPTAGHGMNAGMQDAANLAWKLALVGRGLADHRLIDSYHDERHQVGAAMARKTTLLTDLMTMTGPRSARRDAVMRLAGHAEPFTRRVAEDLAELPVDYRRSPICGHAGVAAGGTVRPGDHVGDTDGLTDRTGSPVIEDLLRRYPGHLLLSGTGDAGDLARLQCVLGDVGTVLPVTDHTGPAVPALHEKHSLAAFFRTREHGLALVRPDGYLGWLGQSTDALRDYLRADLFVSAPLSAPVRG